MARQKRNFLLVNPALVTAVLGITLLLSMVNLGPSPLLTRSEPLIGDFLVRQRNALAPQPVADQITLIGIDDKTSVDLGAYGKGVWITRKPFLDQIPYFRSVFKPKVVAFDIVFKEAIGQEVDKKHQGDSLLEDYDRLMAISQSIQSLAHGESEITDHRILTNIAMLSFALGDLNLVNAMAGISDENNSKTLLAYYFPEDRTKSWNSAAILGDDDGDLSEDNGTMLPYLQDMSIPRQYVQNIPDDYDYYKYAAELPSNDFLDYCSLGYIDVPREEDGLIRRVQLLRGIEYEFKDPETGEPVTRRLFLPSYSLLSCLYYWDIDLNNPGEEIEGPPPIEVIYGDRIIIRPKGRPEVNVPIDESGYLFLDFVGHIKSFNNISFAKVIDEPLDEMLTRTGYKANISKEKYDLLNDKLVMVGITETGNTDVGPCPVDSNTPFVHVHMTAASNILTGTFLRPLSSKEGALALVGLWLLLMPCSAFLRPVRYSVLVGLVALGYFATVYGMVQMHKFILPVVPPAAFMLSSYLGVLLYNYLSEQREKKKIRGMFSTMVSGDVLNYLEENPESFSLAGQKMEATMFFSDLAGFTTISETLGAEKLVELLNAYLSPMTDIIMASNGYVDKYEGDAIMAEWGVPYPLDDHATRACWAALDQQKLIAELAPGFKKEFGVDVMARMGLNSGIVAAGNMGSEKRFSYTVMGDAVNQAARFEPANKDYETLVMIGESTHELAKNDIEARLLDKIIVKGKTVPIQVYELVAKKGEISDDQRRALELYDLGLKIHWKRSFREAIDYFQQVVTIIPDDGPSLTMIERVKKYIEIPPPDSWQGEFVRTTK
jgi:class 3 adenylate cyclase/CHASE2 domain-containing sensor protein